MSITIELPPEVEKKLRQLAAEKGKPLDRFVQEYLLETFVGRASDLEDEQLLQEKARIHMSETDINRYEELLSKRDNFSLTNEEHQKLIDLTDQIERRNAERMPYLLKLAELRGTTPEDLVQELGWQ